MSVILPPVISNSHFDGKPNPLTVIPAWTAGIQADRMSIYEPENSFKSDLYETGSLPSMAWIPASRQE